MGGRLAIPLLLALLVAAPACGGGGGGGGPEAPAPLNRFEAQLAGTYELYDFMLYADAEGLLVPGSYESWDGTLVLGEDRYASLRFDMCEHGSTEVETCERTFVWGADVGWVFFQSTDPTEPNALAVWEMSSGRRLHTEFRVPMNRPDAGFILIESGREEFDWRPVE